MHGLINRSIQSFVCQTYGRDLWLRVMRQADLGFEEFESMLTYDDRVTYTILDHLAVALSRGRDDILEDLGTFLVSNPELESLRRLLRFAGVTYTEFLHSLDDLPDRTRLAVSDLHLPRMALREYTPGQFTLTCHPGIPGFGHVIVGVLRAMADDYGALVMLTHEGQKEGVEVISISVVETRFAEGRKFDLGAWAG